MLGHICFFLTIENGVTYRRTLVVSAAILLRRVALLRGISTVAIRHPYISLNTLSSKSRTHLFIATAEQATRIVTAGKKAMGEYWRGRTFAEGTEVPGCNNLEKTLEDFCAMRSCGDTGGCI